MPEDRGADPGEPAEGILVVDKPAGWTSHDVVAKVRRIAGTRRVGHAGTLDPMATGLLVLGLGRATRLLGYISGCEKSYTATIRLGQSSTTDDAEGELLPGADACGLGLDDLLPAMEALTGAILQRPASVSAIKVDGQRAHRRVRAGETVQLPARPVVVSVFDIVAQRRLPGLLDLDVEVTCSAGTYVRSLARDLGAALGVGGHLTALRRVAVGGFSVEEAQDLAELAEDPQALPAVIMTLDEAAQAQFPVISVEREQAVDICHGRPVDLGHAWMPYRDLADQSGGDWTALAGEHAVLGPDGRFLALVAPAPDGSTRYLAVFCQPG